MKRLYTVNGAFYESYSEIAKATGLSISTVQRRMHSGQYDEWKVVSTGPGRRRTVHHSYRKPRRVIIIELTEGSTFKGTFSKVGELHTALKNSGIIAAGDLVHIDTFRRRLEVLDPEKTGTLRMGVWCLLATISEVRHVMVIDGHVYPSAAKGYDAIAAAISKHVPYRKPLSRTSFYANTKKSDWAANLTMDQWVSIFQRERDYNGRYETTPLL